MVFLDENIPSPDSMEDFETGLTIRQAINALPEDLQEIVFLRFVNDLSMMEVSRITGLSRFSIYWIER